MNQGQTCFCGPCGAAALQQLTGRISESLGEGWLTWPCDLSAALVFRVPHEIREIEVRCFYSVL